MGDRLKDNVAVITGGTPEVAEAALARGDADMVSMARPLLADPELVAKAARGESASINTCIGCNQACLDRVFANGRATCLVNPRAAYETERVVTPCQQAKRIAVVGAGPAGLSAAATAAERGHDVVLYEAAERIGGQFRLACRVPGKSDYAETIRYFEHRLAALGVTTHLGVRADLEAFGDQAFDVVLLASGVRPRIPGIPGIDHPSVISYDRLRA